MAYVNAQSPNRRLATLGTVAVIHVLAGYAIVNGLAAKWQRHVDPRIQTTDFPLPKPTPTPEPRDKQQNPIVKPRSDDPAVTPTPPLPFPPGGGTIETGSGETGGDEVIGEVIFPPQPPTPPLFTPRRAKPRSNEASWVTDNDYPTNDVRLEHEGLTRVRLGVGINGRVTDCTVTASSGWPGLDAATCAKLTNRARFEPASDQTGAKIEGSYNTAVRWRLPEE